MDQNPLLYILCALVLITFYLIPSIIAALRGVEKLLSVIAVNLAFGFTGAGWVAAFILAVGLPPAPRARPLPYYPVPLYPHGGLGTPEGKELAMQMRAERLADEARNKN